MEKIDTLYLSYFTKGYLAIPLHEDKEPEIVDHLLKRRGEFCPMLWTIKHENYQKVFIYNGNEVANQGLYKCKSK